MAADLLALKPELDRLYDQFNLTHSTRDPIGSVRRVESRDDREIVAFLASALAFGRVQSVLQTVDAVLAAMGGAPAAFVRDFRPELAARFDGVGHRWIRSRDLAALTWLLHQMVRDHGSIEGFFAAGLEPGADSIAAGLESFSTRAMALDLKAIYGRRRPTPGVGYFFSRPSSGGACKRLNLFLRWAVRDDAVDLGLWRAVRPAQLVVPLDTHTIRMGKCLRLTRRASPGWKMAAEITAALRAHDAADPIRYDFALCHLSMMGGCGYASARGSADCPLRGHCHPRKR